MRRPTVNYGDVCEVGPNYSGKPAEVSCPGLNSKLDFGTEQKRGLPVESTPSMHTVVCGVAALAVAGIFYTWRSYQDMIALKQQTLRERVTYMLWIMANGVTE